MTEYTTGPLPGGRMYLARTRGMASGMMLILLGVWAALVPFIGTYLNFAFTPTSAWTWTAARGWYEVLPGAAAFLGGLLLIGSAHRAVTLFGAWLGILAGAWLIVGPQLANILHLGSLGTPTSSRTSIRDLEWLLYFYAIGGAMILVAAAALGRLSVRSLRDIEAAGAREAALDDMMTAEQPVAAAPGTNRPHHGHFPFVRRNREQQMMDEEAAARSGRHATIKQRDVQGPPQGE